LEEDFGRFVRVCIDFLNIIYDINNIFKIKNILKINIYKNSFKIYGSLKKYSFKKCKKDSQFSSLFLIARKLFLPFPSKLSNKV